MNGVGILSPNAPPGGSVRDWLDENADHMPDKVSHLFPGSDVSFTWSSLRDAAIEFARRIAGFGLRAEDSVALMLPNSSTAIAAVFGALYGGFRLTEINLAAGADAIGYALAHSESKLVICGADQRDLLEEALALHACDLSVVSAGTQEIDWPEDSRAGALPAPPVAETQGLLMYTSGTTGRPKGVVHSHASLMAGGWTTAVAHKLTPDDIAFCVLPHYHINGLCVTVIAPLVSCGAVAVAQKFSASKFWDQAISCNATWFSVVPTIISHLLQGDAPSVEQTSQIRFGRSASAPLSPDVHETFEDRFGIPLVETMGLTETAAQILSNPLPPGVRKIGSPGVAVCNEVIVGDANQNELPYGEEGELLVRGPNVMSLYLKNPQATKDTITDEGWLRTGDLGRMDEDGYVFITGRLKELIIKGGENIAPREIDDALYSHPDVVEAAAFPRPCKSYGERVEAAVRLRVGSGLTADDLVAICHERLGKFKSPDRIFLLEDLPKGPSGKILRRKVAELTLAQ